MRAETLVDLLGHRAEHDPDTELVRFDDGARLTVGEVEVRSRLIAARFARFLPKGSPVATCVSPGPAAVELMFGLARSGLVEVPLALDVMASSASVVLRATGAQVLVVGTAALGANPALADLAPRVVLVREDNTSPTGLPFLDDLPATGGDRRPEPGDPLAALSTSGTTGRAKAAVLPHFAAVRHARRVAATMRYGPGDVLYNVFPWNHINVRHAGLLPALLSGARLVAHPRFSASRFWEICRTESVTAFNFMGAMLAILDRLPATSADRDHHVRQAYGAPAPVDLARRFHHRFGVRALEAYACTELGDVAANTRGSWRPGTAGQVVPEYEVAILDDEGKRLPPGQTGQIAARARLPHMTFSGYAGDPAASAAVLRDGWFTTGDRGRLDAEGYLTFAGRRVDVVRRRGENIATWDVEEVLRAMPGVFDAAAVGVPSELTEEEILAVLAAPGAEIDGPAVRDWCRTRLPRHAVPRYVRIVPDLPRNPNGKVTKPVLVAQGIDESTWDSVERTEQEKNVVLPTPAAPLRVLDLTDELAFQGARSLVGLGADVVRVEPGAELDAAERIHWHAGKRWLRLPDEPEALGVLAAEADVVLESGPLATLRGLTEDSTSRWPHAVHVVVTPFGLTGPRRNWLGDDLVLASAGGMSWLGGHADRQPKPPPREQALQVAGMHAAIAAQLGVLARDRTGTGQLVDVSAQDAVAATLETAAISWIHAGRHPVRNGGVYDHVAHRIFAAADGYVAGGYSGSVRMWTDLLAWLVEEGEAADLVDERLSDPVVRWAERAHVDEVIARFVAKRTAREVAEEGRSRALPWAEVTPPARLVENPQLLDRNFFVKVGPDGVQDAGFPWEAPGLPRPITLPAFHEGTWATRGPRGRCRREGPESGGRALDGVRVLDLTWVLAGPYATKLFAEHGAEVIKIESRHRHDPTRFSPSMRLRPDAGPDDSGYFLNFNRNKRSVALNLKTAEGQRLLRDLVSHCDIVVENFSPGVLAKWGMDYESLRQLNPDVILVSMSGVGHTGPWRKAVTFADTLAAMSGLSSETGDPGEPPQGLIFGLGDMVAANAAVVAALELLTRHQGGHVDLSQLEAMAANMGPAVVEQVSAPDPRTARHPNRSAQAVPHGVYPAAGEDRWVAISVREDAQWRALRDLAGLPGDGELADRRAVEDEIDDALAAWTRGQDAAALAGRLQSAGVPAAVVATGRDLVEADEQLASRGFYQVLDHPIAGPVRHEGIVAHLSATPGALVSPAPLLGQDTAAVLGELLGVDDEQLAALRAAGALE